MRYHPSTIGSTVLVPKLLGSFECELHPILDEIIGQRFQTIINVGCAEGYYSVGLALKFPGAQIHAFELDPSFRHLCAQMARLNEVHERITVHSAATPEELRVVAHDGGVLIVCDCEGCEFKLLNPAIAPPLEAASILVELHDFVNRGLSDQVLSRFQETHVVRVVDSTSRDPREYDELKTLNEEDAVLAVNEFRPERMQWAWMKPRNAADRR